MDQDPGLCVLRRQDVAVDGNPPSLIHSHLSLTSHSVDHRGQLGAKEEDVDTAVAGNVVEVVRHGLLEDSAVDITDQLAIDVDRCAALEDWLEWATWHTLTRADRSKEVQNGTYERDGGIIQNGLSALVDQLWRAR